MGTDTQELANGYTLLNDTQFSAGQFLLQRLRISSGMRVLDVGCGPGNLTANIGQLVGEHGTVLGIDPSVERIKLAREINMENLSFAVGKAEDLSLIESQSMDIVFVNSTFHWVQDQAKAMHEFARVLRRGGRVGLSGGSGDFTAIHEKIKAEVLARPPYNNYPEKGGPKFLKKHELEVLLKSAGFVDEDIVVNTIVKRAENGEKMVEWLDTSSSGQTYGGIPLEMRPSAKAEMKQEWEKYTTAEGIKMDMELLVTIASRA